jgi:hypothetical protein
MNRYFTLPLAVLAVTALAACQEDGGTATVQTETNFSLAGFHAWPEGQAETADLESVGRDNLVIVVDRSGSMDGNACQSSTTPRARKPLPLLSSSFRSFPATLL